MSRVTTVIVSRNRRAQLLRTVAAYEGPVIVVDNASQDGSVEALERDYPDVRVMALSTDQGASARNFGVRAAQTPYVTFAGSDSRWAPGMLGRAAAMLDENPTLGLVAASVLVGTDSRPDLLSKALLRSPLRGSRDLPGVPILGFISTACVVRRQPFLDAGGFDALLRFANEEERLALDLADAGWALRLVPELIVRRGRPESGFESHRRARRAAHNDVLTALMRRPFAIAWRRSIRHATSGVDGTLGVVSALIRAPKAIVSRRLLSQRVELRAEQLELSR